MVVDQKDPGRVYFPAIFESEEKARAREQDIERQQAPRRPCADSVAQERDRCGQG